MSEEILLDRGTTRVRRLRLEPGEAMPWHVDPFHRVSVVLNGNSLTIEGRDGGTTHVKVTPGQVDWDEPSDRPHRGVNSGTTLYEEVLPGPPGRAAPTSGLAARTRAATIVFREIASLW